LKISLTDGSFQFKAIRWNFKWVDIVSQNGERPKRGRKLCVVRSVYMWPEVGREKKLPDVALLKYMYKL
jgi:hypothetical protein